ncbi:hypothetical protein [Burkholderia ubonensis]|uniref:hypothetical protein n=1 Tax=Burkholderia ubonensis TaxID=101571 RepID=UPI000F5726E4|nr:hypothetical protein [Burkholderia ubonensis]
MLIQKFHPSMRLAGNDPGLAGFNARLDQHGNDQFRYQSAAAKRSVNPLGGISIRTVVNAVTNAQSQPESSRWRGTHRSMAATPTNLIVIGCRIAVPNPLSSSSAAWVMAVPGISIPFVHAACPLVKNPTVWPHQVFISFARNSSTDI